jgi:MYXO-CTERM domain-containing protein
VKVYLLLVTILLLAPLGYAQTDEISQPGAGTDTTLFFHPIAWTSFVINTQPLSPSYPYAAPFAATSQTLTCLSGPLGNTGGLENEYHEFRGRAVPTLVQYERMQGGKPFVEPVNGIAQDVVLDPNGGTTLHWFMVSTSGSAPVPNLRIQATVRSGDELSVNHAAYDAGDLLLSGSLGPMTLVGGSAYGPNGQPVAGVTSSASGSGTVYGFAIPMTVHQGLFEASKGFNVRVEAFLENPLCSATGGSIMSGNLAPFADATRAPRLVIRHSPGLTVVEPFSAEAVKGVGVLFRIGLQSVWGRYDVNLAGASLQLTGPATEPLIDTTQTPTAGPHPSSYVEPVYAGWLWDFNGITPPNGDYTVTLNVSNLQGTATSTHTYDFKLKGGNIVLSESKDAPAPGAAMVLLGLAAVALLARRRA